MTKKKVETVEPNFWPFTKKSDGNFDWASDTYDAAANVFGLETALDIVKYMSDSFFSTIRYPQDVKSDDLKIPSIDDYFTGQLPVIRIAASLKAGCRYTSTDPGAVAVFQFLMLSDSIPEALQFVKDCTIDTPRDRDWNYTLLTEFFLYNNSRHLPSDYMEAVKQISTAIPPSKCKNYSTIRYLSSYISQIHRSAYISSERIDNIKVMSPLDITGLDTQHWLIWACADPYARLDNIERTKDLPQNVIDALKGKFPFALPFSQDYDTRDDGAILNLLIPLLSETTDCMMNKAFGIRMVKVYEKYISNHAIVTTNEVKVSDRIFWILLLSSDPVKLLERMIKRYSIRPRVIRMLTDGSTEPKVLAEMLKIITESGCSFSLPPWPSLIRK